VTLRAARCTVALLFALAVVWVATVVLLVVPTLLLPGCAPLLNPDPKTGGACRNGDQLGTPCGDGSCAPAGYRCAYDGRGWEIDEGQIGPGDVGGGFGAKAHDAGGE
jgi:hypothetical protein